MLSPLKFVQAARLLETNSKSVLFISSLVRAREFKIASALRSNGWKVVLLYLQNTPFKPDKYFDVVIPLSNQEIPHQLARVFSPRLCHIFSGAIDDVVIQLCSDKPSPIIVDLNDIFCRSLFNYCEERFVPTRECLSNADGLCARDLQAKVAQCLDGYKLPPNVVLFPEYPWGQTRSLSSREILKDANEVHVVSVGTFTLESQGVYDSGYLQLAKMLTKQKIHFHIYPHWDFQKNKRSSSNFSLKEYFSDFFNLAQDTPYLHIHQSASLENLEQELSRYDFGIVAGGSLQLGQRLKLLTSQYMNACYSGRIADYLDAGLPVLINPELGYNYWLLKHYRIGIDLTGLFKPNFRDELLAIKRDPAWAQIIHDVVDRLSIARQGKRLITFYTKVLENGGVHHPPRPKWRISFLLFQWLRISFLTIKLFGHDFLNKPRRSKKLIFKKVIRFVAKFLGIKSFAIRLSRIVLKKELDYQTERISLYQSRLDGLIDDIPGLLNWPEFQDKDMGKNGFSGLIKMIKNFCTVESNLHGISAIWMLLNTKHLDYLLTDGFRRFKQTISLDHFTFPVQEGDPQLKFLRSSLSDDEARYCQTVMEGQTDEIWPKIIKDRIIYRNFLSMLLMYVRKMDRLKLLDRLEEPEEGSPIVISFEGRQFSQDLCNSILEYYSIIEGVEFDKCKEILEIGGGYGRNAYMILKLHPHIKYLIVDIPPALYLAQRYLSTVFSDRKIFHARDFKIFSEVENEIVQSSIVFLFPHQLALLPEKRFDLTFNISSFGEMKTDQIENYLQLTDQVTKGHFYFKQWKESKNPLDGLLIREEDYPIPSHWRRVYSRECKVQSQFFEALFDVGGGIR